jgi:hypothetical protein
MASAAGAVGSIFFQNKAIQAQEKAMRLEKQARMTADARERRRSAREMAMQRGALVNVASQIGGGQGSQMGTAITGGLSGLQNQYQSGVGFQATTARIGQQLTNLNMQANKYMGYASMAQGIGQAVGSFTDPKIATKMGL